MSIFTKYAPHLLVFIDTGWISVKTGMAYYDINWDAFRPFFFEIVIWKKWRITFEFGKISKYGGY